MKKKCSTCKKYKTKESYTRVTSNCIPCTKKINKKKDKKRAEALKLYRSFYN